MTDCGTALREVAEAIIDENKQLRINLKDLQEQNSALRLDSKSESASSSALIKTAKDGVTLLLEGDTFHFRSSLVAQGYQGGQDAARVLRKQIEICAEELQLEQDYTVSVQILVSSLDRMLLGPNKANYQQFVAGFTLCPLFDIDYCGDSKQVACKKLQELLKLNVAAEHVKLVLFGGREDSAHINLLTALKAAGTEKLMLIAHDNMSQDIRALNLPIKWRFDELFTSSEVLLSTGPASTATPSTTQQPHDQQSKYRTAPCYHFQMGQCAKGDACTYLHTHLPAEQMAQMPAFTDSILTRTVKSSTDLAVYVPLLFAVKGGCQIDPRGARRNQLGQLVSIKSVFVMSSFTTFKEYSSAAAALGLVNLLSGEGPGYERIALGAKVKDLVLQQGMTGDKLAKALAFRMSGRPTPRAPPPQQRNPTQPYNMNRSDLDWTDGSDSLESPGSGWE